MPGMVNGKCPKGTYLLGIYKYMKVLFGFCTRTGPSGGWDQASKER